MRASIDLDVLGAEDRREYPGLAALDQIRLSGERLPMPETTMLVRAARTQRPEDPQRLADLLAQIGRDQTATDERRAYQRDALLALSRCGGWSVPPGGIAYECEAPDCGATSIFHRRSRRVGKPIDWVESVANVRREADRIGIGLSRFSFVAGGRLIRWIVVCGTCARHRIRRCRHQDVFSRCDEVVAGRQYCDLHRTSSVREQRLRLLTSP